MAETQLPEQDKLSCVLVLSGFVRNDATLTADFAAASGGEQVMPGYGTLLAEITSADEFPSLHRAIASGALDDEDDPDVEYLFGLARILDGIAELVSRAETQFGSPDRVRHPDRRRPRRLDAQFRSPLPASFGRRVGRSPGPMATAR